MSFGTKHILILLLLISLQVSSQEKWNLVKKMEVNIDDFYTDNLGYIYQLKNNEIIKINYDGDTLFQFSDKLLGDITELDVRNTLRPIIFCKDNAQLIITDNTLTIQNQGIDLSELDLYQASLIASSRIDNGIWIYDRELFQLIKINSSVERIYESGNLEQILGKENLNPIQLVEFENKVYLLSKENGIMVFDIYGSYINTIEIKNIEAIQILSQAILYQKEEKYYVYNPMDFESKEVDFPVPNIRKARIEKNNLILWNGKELFIYSRDK